MIKLSPPKNEFGYDLVRIVAMFSVLCLHFFLYSGYYAQPPCGMTSVIHTFFRNFFYLCVPSFIMLTGALLRKSTFCGKHYIKLIPVILNSLVIGGIVIAYKVNVLKEVFPVIVWAETMWSFKQPNYGWYINMYISLFLLIPFINAAYASLKSQKQKLIAVIIVVFTTTFASAVIKIPLDNEFVQHINLVPNYFKDMWPLAYYVVGMYIDEFRPKINKLICSLVLAVLLLGQAALNYHTMTENFYTGINFENNDTVTLISALFLFLLLYDIKINNIPIRRIAAVVSSASISFYLLSWIGDNYFYNKHLPEFTGFDSYPRLFFKIVPLHILLCLIASLIVSFAVKLISRLITKPLYGLCSKRTALPDEEPEKVTASEK